MEATAYDEVRKAADSNAGRAIVVVGHSNTVPELVRALGVNSNIELTEGDYGDLFVVTLEGGAARLSRQRFGDR